MTSLKARVFSGRKHPADVTVTRPGNHVDVINIAEDVVYLYEAIDIRHSGQKLHEDKDTGS